MTSSPPDYDRSTSRVMQITAESKRVILALNPHAGSRSTRHLVDELAELLASRGLAAEIVTDREELGAKAAEYQAAGTLRTVVGIGGDGTQCEVANRIPAGVPLTVFPGGTENLLARYLGMRRDPDQAAKVIADGLAVRLDVGQACSTSQGNVPRLFLLMADAGFDAEVVRLLHDERTGHISRWTYFKPFWQALRRYEHPPMRVYCDGELQADREVQWAFLFNLPCYAAGLPVIPHAIGTDGWLDLLTFRKGNWWRVLLYLSCAVVRQHRRLPGCEQRRVRRIRIEADRPTPYLLDGDPGGWLPLEIELIPERLPVLVPRAWVEKMLPDELAELAVIKT